MTSTQNSVSSCASIRDKEEMQQRSVNADAQHMFKLLHTTGVSTAFPDSEVVLRI